MCLASRLCTQANLGNMHEFREIVKMIIGNIALVQIQAIVAAILVSIFAIISAIAESSEYSFEWNHCLLLAASSVSTATSSCFILGKIIVIESWINFPFYNIYVKLANPIRRTCNLYSSIHAFFFIIL